MGVTRSTNPTDWNAVDGIAIDEVTPPPSVGGVPANTALIIGQFERGPTNLITSVGSVGQLYEIFGNNLNYQGQVALQNMQFGALKVVRATAAAAAAATKTFNNASSSATVVVSALWKGAYGNNITVAIAAGSDQGSKYTIHDASPGAVFPDEVYDNVLITAGAAGFAAIFGSSNLIAVPTISSTTLEPAPVTATALATGTDGTIADTDYQTAITAQQVEAAANVVFLDTYNTVRNGYLKVSMAATTDRMALICGAAGDSVATAITNVASYRDTQGRLIYAFPYVYTNINGVSTKVNPCAFYAALLSQTSPSVDPAYAINAQYLVGITSLELALQRSDYVSLVAAGISAYETDSDLGIKVKSGVVTQISNSALTMIFRRRMADYLTYSIAKFLKNYQNAPNTLANRTAAGAAISNFNRQMEQDGLVPSDAEVLGGAASIVDVQSLNTDTSLANGYFKLLYRRRIYSSMRYIVLQADISQSVVVTEQT